MPYALMAPITSVPSRPRLMRPERSVMHSPRLTNRKGVETRIAPPNTASGTVQSPIPPSAISGFPLQKADAAIERVARQHEHEDDALQHQHGRIRQSEPALQQPAARLALVRPCTAATSTMPARPALAPARKQMVRISLPTERPTIFAARILPPATRAAKPNVV